jgi:hypothetical protein
VTTAISPNRRDAGSARSRSTQDAGPTVAPEMPFGFCRIATTALTMGSSREAGEQPPGQAYRGVLPGLVIGVKWDFDMGWVSGRGIGE